MRKPTPKYANVTATLALFVALGGTSFAAATISSSDVQNGSLTGADVRNESLKSRDIDNGSLTGSDLRNGSVKSSDVDDASLLAADFKPGELPAGPQGPQGPQGPAGATSVVTRRADVTVPNNQFREPDVSCLPGETVVGGGAAIGAGILGLVTAVFESAPIESDGSAPENGETSTGWSARGFNTSGVPQTLRVYVLCATP
jgi:hypothetical protein